MRSLRFQHQREIHAFAFRDIETTDCKESPPFRWVSEKFPRNGRLRAIKRGPVPLMNSAARCLFSGVRKPWTRERKYQTRLGSWNSTAANCMFGCKDSRDT